MGEWMETAVNILMLFTTGTAVLFVIMYILAKNPETKAAVKRREDSLIIAAIMSIVLSLVTMNIFIIYDEMDFLPEERIHMNVIDMYTQSLQKKLPDDMFIFVDDSPHNIVMSKAAHRIMPARRHNANRMVKGMIDNVPVDRPATPSGLRKLVIGYLEEERRSGYEL